MLNYVLTLLKDTERKPLYKVALEMTECTIREKEIPYYYLANLLYKKDVNNYRDYIGRTNMYKVINNLFDPYNTEDLQDKFKFSEIMSENNLPSPITQRLSSKGRFYINGVYSDISQSEFTNLLKSAIDASKSQSIFIKPINLNAGRYCFEVNNESLNDKSLLKEIFDFLKTEEFIYQETIQQHSAIDKIYKDSVNTIRLHSYFDKKNDKVEIISALMRFGKDGTKVDNTSAGGLYVPIDIEEETLKGLGRSFYKHGGKYFIKHPNSEVVFNNYKLPFMEEVYEIVDKASRLFNNPVIGWDLAITTQGISIVEGNYCPHLVMAQVAAGGFRNNPEFMRAMGEYIDN